MTTMRVVALFLGSGFLWVSALAGGWAMTATTRRSFYVGLLWSLAFTITGSVLLVLAAMR